MMLIRIIGLFSLCMTGPVGHAFCQLPKQEVLSVEAYIQQIIRYHPVSKRAGILISMAEANLLAAKGGFDPVASLASERKTFQGKNYYYYNNPEIKFPTPIAMSIKMGLENNGGPNATPEVTTGRSSYVGVEVPVVQGLLIDKRRAVLRQASILRTQSEQDRLAAINDLLVDSYVAYFQWSGSYQLYNVFNKYLQIANNRLRLIRIAYKNGDKAIIDTVEAYTQVQNYQLQQTEALQKLNNARLELSNFLWLESDKPYQLPDNLVPDTIRFTTFITPAPLQDMIDRSLQLNPSLKSYEFKLNSLEVERRLKFQGLLPVVNLKANLLNRDYYALKGISSSFLENNYKWGIEFKMPLFLREGRGEYQKAKLKIREIDLELSNKRWQTENKIRSYYNEVLLLRQQLSVVDDMYNSYSALLRNEELKFTQGESSLFLVNSRETKVLELLQKKIELVIKYNKANYSLEWASGEIYQLENRL